jgi:hypothetical protein
VRVPDPNDPEARDAYAIEDVTLMDWPTHYRNRGDPMGILEFARPEVYIKV